MTSKMQGRTTVRNGNDILWDQVLEALCAGDWILAREGLDVLIQKHTASAADCFPSIDSVLTSKRLRLMPAYAQALQDRVDAWNSAATARAAHLEAADRARNDSGGI